MCRSTAHEFAITDSEVLATSPIFTVRRDTVTMPGGSSAKRDVLEHFGAVAIVLEKDGEIGLIRQHRHALRRRLWELPAGLLDVADEDPLTAAQRELAEEVQLGATDWQVLVDVASAPGYCDEVVRVYLATGVTTPPAWAGELPDADDEEAEIELRWVPLDEAVEMVFRGEIINSSAIAGVLTTAQYKANHEADGVTLRPGNAPFALRPRLLAQRRAESSAQKGD